MDADWQNACGDPEKGRESAMRELTQKNASDIGSGVRIFFIRDVKGCTLSHIDNGSHNVPFTS